VDASGRRSTRGGRKHVLSKCVVKPSPWGTGEQLGWTALAGWRVTCPWWKMATIGAWIVGVHPLQHSADLPRDCLYPARWSFSPAGYRFACVRPRRALRWSDGDQFERRALSLLLANAISGQPRIPTSGALSFYHAANRWTSTAPRTNTPAGPNQPFTCPSTTGGL
jgi:hypothetical protein